MDTRMTILPDHMLMIHGFFFLQQGFESVLRRWNFSGLIHHDEDGAPKPAGSLTDYFGESILSNIELGDLTTSFTKRYEHRENDIGCILKKVSVSANLWTGTWDSPVVGTGRVNCVITQVPDEFLLHTFVR